MSSLTLRRARVVYGDGFRGMWLAFAGFALVMIVLFGAIGWLVYATGQFDDPDWGSVWEQAEYGSRYFPLSMGVVLMAAFLPVVTAHGVTRTSFVIGSAGLLVTMGAVVAVLLAVGHWVEYRLYDAGGGVQDFSSPHLFSSGREVGLVFTESLIVVTANVVGGFFIAAAYHRWRALRATLALPLLVLPIAAVEAVVSAGWPGNVMSGFLGIDRGPLGVVIPVSVAIIAATLVLTLSVLRTTDLRTSSG